MTRAPLLQLDKVSISLPNSSIPLVDSVSFSLQQGEILGICGRSGSGKTLLTQAILQLQTDLSYQGDILFDSLHLMSLGTFVEAPLYGCEIGYIPQDAMSSLNPLHRLDKTFRMRLSLLKNGNNSPERILEVLELVGLDAKILTRYPHQISGGQQQRVIIALNLLGAPKLIIADEPTSSLDSVHQKDILDALESIVKHYNTSLIFISHSIGSLYYLSDQVLMMHLGKICEQASKDRFFTSPVSQEARDFVLSSQKTLEQKPEKFAQTDNKTPILEVHNFAVPQYQERALGLLKAKQIGYRLAPVNLAFQEKRSYGIIGKSGSGKTSLGLGLLNLCESSGLLCWEKQEVKSMSKIQLKAARASFLPVLQNANSLNSRMRVYDIISEGLDIHFPQMTEEQKRQQIESITTDCSLDISILDAFPHQCSGGQRQRIAFARSLILKPKFVLLDEPTSALDSLTQNDIIRLIQRLQKQFSITLVVMSHDIYVIRALCDYLLVIDNGVVVEQGDMLQVFNQPQQAITKELISCSLELKVSQREREATSAATVYGN